MTVAYTKKQVIILLILLLIAVGVIVGVHFLYLKPLEASLTVEESNLEQQKQLLQIATEKEANQEPAEPIVTPTENLELAIPNYLGIQSILSNIENAEMLSQTHVLNISVQEQAEDTTDEATEEELTSEEVLDEGTTDYETKGEAAESEETTETTEVAEPTTTSVKRTDLTITFEGDTEEQLKSFIRSLEASDRLMQVTSFNYSYTEITETIDEMTSEESEEEPAEEETEEETTVEEGEEPTTEEEIEEAVEEIIEPEEEEEVEKIYPMQATITIAVYEQQQ